MAPTQANAYERHTVRQYVLSCNWQCTCKVCSEHKPQSAALVHTVSLASHHFHKMVERRFIIVEDQNIFTCIHKLKIKLQITGSILQVSTPSTLRCPCLYTSLSLSLHFAVPVSTLRCPCLYTSLSLSLHFPVIVSTLPCHCLYTSLSLSLHFTVPVSTLHCPCLYTSLSLSLHFTVLVSTLHCSIYLAVPGSTHPNDREH